MALTFPSTPNVNDIYQPSGSAASYRWTGTYWQIRQSANPLFGANQSGSVLQIDAAGYAVASPVIITSGIMSVTASTATSASFSSTSTSASFASSASNATSASFSTSASFATSASYSESSSYSISSSFATSASYGLSASFATTASWTTTASFATSASRATTASFAVTASYLSGTTPVYLSLTKVSSQSIPTNQETTIVSWANLLNNTPSAWDNATGTFTVPRAGVYDISFSMMLEASAALNLTTVEYAPIINYNGSTIYISNWWPQTTSTVRTPAVTVRVVLQLAVGDTIRPRIYQNLTGGAINTYAGRNHFIINQLPNRIS
jgi:hypothetical protein